MIRCAVTGCALVAVLASCDRERAPRTATDPGDLLGQLRAEFEIPGAVLAIPTVPPPPRVPPRRRKLALVRSPALAADARTLVHRAPRHKSVRGATAGWQA